MSEDTLDRRALLRACVGAGILGTTGCIGSSGEPSMDGVTVETVATGLQRPWGIDFLLDDRVVLTERVGSMAVVAPETGDIERVDGIPDVSTAGQGGLLDVSLHPDYPEPAWLYLTYSGTDGAGATATILGRGRLDPDAAVLTAFERLHVAEPFVESDAHYGSRVVFGPDGAMYVTAGDRQFKDFGPDHVAQDPTNELGTILRLDPDGTVPDDNPFVDDPDGEDAIFSYGHRNPQGLTVHPETDDLWQSEHGEEDGDELNVIERGGNYGWPIATYACRYGTDDPVGDRPDEREDLVEPVYYWECGSGGFPPAGMTFYDGDAFPDWRGDLFVGNLAGRSLGRFAVDGREVTELDPLFAERGWRIRAVEDHPRTGHLYVVIDDEDAPLVRLVPET